MPDYDVGFQSKADLAHGVFCKYIAPSKYQSTGEEATMSLQIRRVVTGHDANGHAIVEVDEIAKNVISNRPGASSCVVWSTKGFPVDNDGFADPTAGSFKTTVEGGTVFRIVHYAPGVTPRNHRTDSIDYAVIISGAIEMELDDGVVAKLMAGDVLVQRGTIHNWVNRGTEPCIIAFVLIAAKPVTASGKPLHAVG
jgi:quercetin dioxygenase-like cupin family protein